MTRSIFQNCCSKIKRWSIESNFILCFVEDKESLNVFSVNFEKSYCFA